MGYLYYFAESYPILSAFQMLFTIGMMVDAYRRGVEQYWYYFIPFVPFIGAWTYFFAIFLPHFTLTSPFWERKTPVEELRFRAKSTPTFANDFALGHRLTEMGRFEEAIEPLQNARKREPDHAPACFHLARCLYEIGQPAEALPFVQRILDKEPRFEDYAAWRLLMQIQTEMDLDEAALDTARQLVKQSPRTRGVAAMDGYEN